MYVLRRQAVRRLGLVTLAALALSACGRKGALEPPPGAPQAQQREPQAVAAAQENRVLQNADDPGLIQSPNKVYETPAAVKLQNQVAQPPHPINADPVPRAKPFILDPILN